ncbi:MAG: hypothetical protein ABIK27_01570 [Bacteroidota bacterium]
MYTIKEALEKKKTGLYYGNRIILPFKCTMLKLIYQSEIITDFSQCSSEVVVCEGENFTDIYMKKHKYLKDDISKYENIKLIAAEKGSDIFDFSTHIKLILTLNNDHKIKIEEPTDDQVFID